MIYLTPWLLLVALALPVAPAAAGASYYVSASGSDSNPGSADQPWRTSQRVNDQTLRPGDIVRFAGGQSFGWVYLNQKSGQRGAPIVIESYGGRATLAGLFLYNVSYVEIRNLDVRPGSSESSGVEFYGNQPHARYQGLLFSGLDVAGFRNGMLIGTWSCGDCGIDGLRVVDSVLHHNLLAGLNVYAQKKGNNRDVYVGSVVAHHNTGDPAMVTNSGSGIVLGQIDGAIVEHSEAYENGAMCTAGECGAGIWAYEGNNITFRDNLSHHNRTGSHVDGDGFDFDGGVTNSLMERNASHDNDGAGFLLAQYAGASPHYGNVLRGNSSWNDGVKTGFGAFHMFGAIGSANVTGNTIGGPLHVSGYGAPPAVLFDCNTYEGPFAVLWNGTHYSELAQWRAATGQEPSCAPSPSPDVVVDTTGALPPPIISVDSPPPAPPPVGVIDSPVPAAPSVAVVDSALPAAPPVGVIDTPAGSSIVAGEVAFTGWAIDDSGIAGVDVYRSPLPGESTAPIGLVFVGSATQIDGARPDVATAYPLHPGVSRAGWGLMILSNFLPSGGNGAVTLHAVARTFNGEIVVFASRTVVTANAASDLPFGTIDTPGQGGTVSGVATNFGWALTPGSKIIPADGSTIDVYIDGVFAGHPSYGHYRSDIATLFPGYRNSAGAVGFYQFASTALSNGLHTISWVVRDNEGAAQGIGSRFFRVHNP